MARKQRIIVDLDPEQLKWVEKQKLQQSLERGKQISRNRFIAEALEKYKIFLKHKEGLKKALDSTQDAFGYFLAHGETELALKMEEAQSELDALLNLPLFILYEEEDKE
ncbi:hypothetical protein GCM10011571_33590 [Marinithermofilum abyssi]|uniref:Uncharacterized protein n=1 Tax=Marinithermofilum abyssi TaxID=1571185 RepID=A0A8J2VKD4_9BACL|nr:hypothetical protein [Marinithermofilum abyssi]GGE28749.1 hypothetical protein GCM10011571_33590 [Marinithermofilum abyssi]